MPVFGTSLIPPSSSAAIYFKTAAQGLIQPILVPHSGQNCADFATTVSQRGQNRCRFLYCWNSVSQGSLAPQVRQFLSAAVEGSPQSGQIRMFRMIPGPKP